MIMAVWITGSCLGFPVYSTTPESSRLLTPPFLTLPFLRGTHTHSAAGVTGRRIRHSVSLPRYDVVNTLRQMQYTHGPENVRPGFEYYSESFQIL